MSLDLKCDWGDLCSNILPVRLPYDRSPSVTATYWWSLRNHTLSLSLQADPDSKHLHYPTHKKTLLLFGLSWAVFWWCKNTLKCWITLVLWTTMCMWCSIQSQLAKFYKERSISIKHIRKFFSICMIQLNTCSWLSGSVPHIVYD